MIWTVVDASAQPVPAMRQQAVNRVAGTEPWRGGRGTGPALYEGIPYDEDGKNVAASFIDYLVRTPVVTRAWETVHTVKLSPTITGSGRRVGARHE